MFSISEISGDNSATLAMYIGEIMVAQKHAAVNRWIAYDVLSQHLIYNLSLCKYLSYLQVIHQICVTSLTS